MADDPRRVFLSDSSLDVAAGLGRAGVGFILDPFSPGERRCLKAQQSIKGCTQFVYC
jgi:hypothetical protein